MNLYAVKNDSEEYYDSRYGWNHSSQHVWTNRDDAEIVTAIVGGHVVELVEAPAKVVVSEEEAEMLATLRDGDLMPVGELSYFVRHAEQLPEKESIEREDRLMRAYVNGWTVEKPKRWNVKVPHAKTLIYYKFEDVDDLGVAKSDSEGPWVEFTAAEIEHYGLGDCQKVACADSARTTVEVKD